LADHIELKDGALSIDVSSISSLLERGYCDRGQRSHAG
jgi:hypothetical protein